MIFVVLTPFEILECAARPGLAQIQIRVVCHDVAVTRAVHQP